jgi:alpha-galactosidase
MSGLAATVVTVALTVVAPVAAQVAAAPPAAALANGLASTPQMGWNDWNAFGCNVSAALVEQTAQQMVANGMKKDGYEYVNIDDCWLEPQRDASGDLVPDPAKFPPGPNGESGIEVAADYIHGLGLKLGIYEDAGTATCAGYPGSLGHEAQDAQTFASWGVDYLKYDNCNNDGSTTQQQYIDRYTAMRDALAATGRPILYSLCEWGVNDPWEWAPQVGNSWRTTGDISDDYASMLSNFQTNVWLYPYSKPGAWNDPDMLEVGNGGMTTTEYQSEFSLWAAMDAPLIAGTDLRSISATDLGIYENKAVIAVDQDPLGEQAVPIPAGGEPAGDNGLWVLSKPLANGDHAIVLFNSTGSPATISTTAAEAGLPKASQYGLDNLWTNTETESAGTIAANVPAHGVVMYRVSKGAPSGNAAPDVTVSDTGLPATATPGTPVDATVTLTNYGHDTIKQATLALTGPTGWKLAPTGSTKFSNIKTGGTVSASFAVTAPTATEPLETDTLTDSATYTWPGGHATSSGTQTVAIATPVQAPYLTYSSAGDAPAEYGQIGDQFAVSGAGADLWTDADAYTSIYQSGAVAASSTVTTEVTSAGELSGYGKAGIIVRDSIPGSGSTPEGVILYVSPSGGIQLEYDSNGGDSIDSVTPANGTIAMTTPVYLKLVRDGSTYTGYYSTDDATWTQVGTATVPGQAATQDAGIFVTSHSSGSPVLVRFDNLTVTGS